MHSWAFSKTRFSIVFFSFDASQGYKLKKRSHPGFEKCFPGVWKMFPGLWKIFPELWRMFPSVWKLALRKFVLADFQNYFRKLSNLNDQKKMFPGLWKMFTGVQSQYEKSVRMSENLPTFFLICSLKKHQIEKTQY